jgi:three-Cys-motif partner protein
LSNCDLYTGREQTFIKHFILRNYLERFAIVVGSHWNTLTYIDCFSGPWKVRSDKFEDSSFAIALEQLRKAREVHREQTGRTLRLRCFFLEKTPSAYKRLKHFTDQIDDVVIETKNKKLENAIQDILNFVQEGSSNSFPFIFIDPTGWTGFAMETITPLLQLNPAEVLINFMTEHIRRFIESPQKQTQSSFVKLFGSSEFKDKLMGLEEKDREDALVTAYIDGVRRVGSFAYMSSAIVLHPTKDRTHFHLIYATRDPKGIEVFKDAEKKAMPVMERTRDEAQKRGRVERTGQTEFAFGSMTTPGPSLYFRSLRERYTSRARTTILNLIQSKKRLPYDKAWAEAVRFPLTWENDLKGWLRDLESTGRLQFTGMKATQRVPQRGQNIQIVWKA